MNNNVNMAFIGMVFLDDDWVLVWHDPQEIVENSYSAARLEVDNRIITQELAGKARPEWAIIRQTYGLPTHHPMNVALCHSKNAPIHSLQLWRPN